jgi:DNA-binding HxlR family transcriptional regulator
MIQNKTKKAIIRALQENRRLRWGELKDIVVNEFDAGSERIFRQTLNSLVESKDVFKKEIAKQHTEYYISTDIIELENNAEDFFDTHLPKLKYLIKHIKNNKSKIPDEDLSGYISTLWQITSHLEFKGFVLSYVTGTSRTSKRVECDEIRKRLLELLLSSKKIEDRLNLIATSDYYLNQGTLEAMKIIHNDLKSKGIPWN